MPSVKSRQSIRQEALLPSADQRCRNPNLLLDRAIGLAGIQQQHQSITEDLARLEGELKRAEMALPDDLRGVYDRIVKAKGEDAMAKVEEDCCSGCYQQLPPNRLNDLLLSRSVFCPGCGRLLYLPEDRTAG